MRYLLLTTALILGTASVTPAIASTILFSGTQSNTNKPASPGADCPGATIGEVVIVDSGMPKGFFSSGSSNLGTFTTSQHHCLDAPPPIMSDNTVPYYDGHFDYIFADGTLSGIYHGDLTRDKSKAGLVDNDQWFTVEGGTGIFTGATGNFEGNGKIDFSNGAPLSKIAFSGTITAPGIAPEPATWAMLICGFGGIGSMLRARRLTGALAGL